MDQKTRDRLENEIGALCAKHKCSTNAALRHRDQYVDRRWNPHPPQRFVDWWTRHPDFGNAISTVRAFNCQRYRDEFMEEKAVGLA